MRSHYVSFIVVGTIKDMSCRHCLLFSSMILECNLGLSPAVGAIRGLRLLLVFSLIQGV